MFYTIEGTVKNSYRGAGPALAAVVLGVNSEQRSEKCTASADTAAAGGFGNSDKPGNA